MSKGRPDTHRPWRPHLHCRSSPFDTPRTRFRFRTDALSDARLCRARYGGILLSQTWEDTSGTYVEGERVDPSAATRITDGSATSIGSTEPIFSSVQSKLRT